MIDRDLEISLNLAVSEAARRGHAYVTVEHILYALLHNNSASVAIKACGGSIQGTRERIEEFFEQNCEANKLSEGKLPQPTIGFQRVIQRAVQSVRAAGKDEVNGANLLIAMFAEEESFAAYCLEDQEITRLDLMNFISHRIVKPGVELEQSLPVEDESEGSETTQEAKSNSKKDPLFIYAVDLCERAREQKIDPLIGRSEEIERCVQILARRRKNNPLLVGDAGVGKTAIAEGLALRIVDGKVPDALKEARIFSLDLGSMIAGSKFRGDFEQRLKGVLKSLQKIPKSILFIDEIHTVIGAGAVSGGALDASNLLKPALSSGELRCIGSTTFKEFRTHFEADHALSRRFQKIDVGEPSIDDTIEILKGLKSKYEEHHHVKYSPESLRLATELSAKYINDRRLPDKAIDMIDEAGAALALKQKPGQKKWKTVTGEMIEATVARIARIPPQRVSADDRESLKNLAEELRSVVFGQDAAIEHLVQSIRMSRAGLGPSEKPIGSFMFAGPTGVGKTEVAKQLARIMGIEFLRFDMSEYMERHTVSRLIGAPPGYVGFDQGGLLTEAVTKTPHCVLLLDEIEKAHPDLQNVLLQVMDHGTLTDANGRKTDFRNVILIMTTNAGARELTHAAIGFDRSPLAAEQGMSQAVKDQFSPEFRNRLDAMINFNPLTMEIILKVVDKFLSEVSDRLRQKNVSMDVTPAARSWLAERGFDRLYGARPLGRLIREQISRKLADELLFGKLEKGGRVHVDLENNELKIAL